MTTTTYYNLNIVEGTDIVNPLIVDNPNYEKIDEAMHDNAVAGVTLATEIANATVHAITRENSDCAVIRFIATSNWKAGDSVTVDGVPVTALLPSGETLPDGAYVINANVLCILTGTNLTIYAERKKAENANEITFNDTTVGAELVKLDGEIVRLDEEIDNVNSNLEWKLIGNAIGTTVIIKDFAIYKELKICVRANGDNSCNMLTMDIPTSLFVTGKSNFFNSGSYLSPTSNTGAVVFGTLQQLQLAKFQSNGTDITANSELIIYGK